MKTKTFAIATTLILGAVLGGQVYKYFFSKTNKPEGRIALEEILSIKELHLVRHTYRDLFFLHRKNNINKPVRAVIEVPVTVTAYINLKEVKIVRVNDTIKSIILPHAKMNKPCYEINKMVVRKTRAFQLHAGSDLYPDVSRYLQSVITTRMDSVTQLATRNKILEQAEDEGKDYIRTVLKAVGKEGVAVKFE